MKIKNKIKLTNELVKLINLPKSGPNRKFKRLVFGRKAAFYCKYLTKVILYLYFYGIQKLNFRADIYSIICHICYMLYVYNVYGMQQDEEWELYYG